MFSRGPLSRPDKPATGTQRLKPAGEIAQMLLGQSSVGAMIATWNPGLDATSAAVPRGTVLPEPTSPRTNRCIGCGFSKSA